MKIGIMQPYFFPYIGYISLIKNVDYFILFDPVQFIRHGWIERNRILKPNEGWQYIGVPLEKHHLDTKISDIKIKNDPNWRKKILSQLEHYKKRATYYQQVLSLINEALNIETDSIVKLNEHALKTICNYLDIETPIHIFSEMNLDIETPKAPDEWALHTCKAMDGVTEYWNPPGGISFFDKKKYDQAGIKLLFQQVELEPYNQKRTTFEPGLSIIDVMMFNSKEQIKAMLDYYNFVETANEPGEIKCKK